MTQPNELNPDSSPSSLSRRFLLGAGASAVAALAIPSAAKAQTPSPTPSPTCTPLPPNPNPPCQPSRPFSEPKVVCSQNQEAKLTLDAVQIPIDIPGTTINDLSVRTYNAQLSGPSIYVNPGDKISITLNNQLSKNNPYCDQSNLGHNSPSCFNTTNMHFHGLHVSPSSICKNGNKILSSDDVLYEVAPQKTHEWCVWLPQFHAPGTHWYHAHRHGATGIQVSNGMAGAIIIQEPIENRIVEPADDKLWLIQEVVQIPQSCNPSDNPEFTDAALYWLGVGKTIGTFLVNGTYQPTLTIPSGRIQRWRFINGTATPRGLMNLYLQKVDDQCNPIGNHIPMYLMAVDGISFYGKKPQPKNNWNMSSGNRADFLISLPSGKYCVYKDNYTGQGGPGSNPALGKQLSFKQALAYIDVYQSVEYPDNRWQKIINNPIPGEFPDYLKPIQKTELLNPDKPQKVVFFINPGQSQGPNPPNPPSNPGGNPGGYLMGNNSADTANFQPYQMNCVDYKVKLNTSEVWTLENAGIAPVGGKTLGAGSAHPFHIHVNPFQIASEANKIDPGGPNDSSNWIWWDTIAVEPEKPPIEIWHRFSDYPGEFVIHCHILIHEDQGMMKNVVVVGEGAGPCVPLPNPNHVLPPGPTCSPTNNPSCSTPTSSPQPNSSASPSPQPGSGGGGGRGTGGGGGGKSR